MRLNTMNFFFKPLLAVMLVFFVSVAFSEPGGSSVDLVDQEIAALIQKVERSDCMFFRNGKSYDAEKAADHLRLKWSRGKKYAQTVDAFIENLASHSSWTKKPYFMKCENRDPVTVKEWLMNGVQ